MDHTECLLLIHVPRTHKLSELGLFWKLSTSIFVLIPALVIIIIIFSDSIVLMDLQPLRWRLVDFLHWIDL